MGQQDISDALKKVYPRYVDYKEIMLLTNITRENVQRVLTIMRRRDEIEYKVVQCHSKMAKWTTVYRVKMEED